MASEIPVSNPTTVPPFASKLPPGLLDRLEDERDKYLYTSIDEMKQAVQWSCELAAKTRDRVEQVHSQAVRTNGGLQQAKEDIVELKAKLVAAEPAIKTVNWALWAAKKKVTWGLAAIFVFVLLPVLVSEAPAARAVIVGTVKWVAGI